MTGVVIVGAGPAGLAAAEVLARAGHGPVKVLERQAEPGGIPRLCGHSPFGMREFRRVLGGRAYARRLADAARQAGAEILLNHAVTAIAPGPVVQVSTPDGPKTLMPSRVLLATGAREASRAERLLPGERPLGIVTTGALQDLWFARRALPFRHPVILGSELVAMSAILTCRQMGARPVALVDTATRMTVGAPFNWLPATLGLPRHLGATVEDIHARDGRLHHITLRDASGHVQDIPCDGLVLTGSFRPESALARLSGAAIDPATGGPAVDQFGRTSLPGVFAAGNILRGVETAGWCWAEGRAIAHAMIDIWNDPLPRPSQAIGLGHGLRLVVPQSLSGGAGSGLTHLQLRIDRHNRATLRLEQAGRTLWSSRIAGGPERRLLVDLAQVTIPDATAPLTLRLTDPE